MGDGGERRQRNSRPDLVAVVALVALVAVSVINRSIPGPHRPHGQTPTLRSFDLVLYTPQHYTPSLLILQTDSQERSHASGTIPTQF